MLRLLIIPVILLALLGGAMFWSKAPAEPRADFTFINAAETNTLDPNRMAWMQDIRIGYALFEGLYALDPVTLDAIPGSAFPIDTRRVTLPIPDWLRWPGCPDKTVYTFHIRPQAKWSNGDDLVSQDFIFAWRRMLELPGEYTYLLFYIDGAKEYSETYEKDFKHADFSKVGIEQIDPKTLRVTLKQYVACFPDICAMPAFFPLNQKSMEGFLNQDVLKKTDGKLRIYDQRFTRPPNLVTNGPYVLTAWEFKKRIRMTANPWYWDRQHVKSKVIDQLIAEDLQWAYAKYQTGEVDWITDFNGDIGAELLATHPSDLHVFPSFGTYFYSLNCRPKLNDGSPNPLHDVRVRQAFSRAIDKKVIVDTITRMGQIPTNDFIPVGAFARKGPDGRALLNDPLSYHSPPGLSYDVAAARKLLADAGYPEGRGFPHITLLFNNEAQHGPVGENIRRQWLENLGIDVELQGVDLNQHKEKENNGDFTIARSGWYGDYYDVSTWTDTYKPDSENNYSGWVNQEYADLCHKADIERDPEQRLRYTEQAEEIMLNDAPILPIYTYSNSYLFRDNVKGIPLNARMMIELKSVEVKR